jgi:hypothetical protein
MCVLALHVSNTSRARNGESHSEGVAGHWLAPRPAPPFSYCPFFGGGWASGIQSLAHRWAI